MSEQCAILFPGQGSQAVGMGRDVFEASPAARAVFETGQRVLGFDLARLCFEGPLDTLTVSSNAQPAIFAVSAACYAALQEACPNVRFSHAAGHSLGEWTALWFGGAVSLEDAFRVLRARGQFMQEACEATAGGMLCVIGMSPENVSALCEATGVTAANFNSPDQIVLSGPAERIQEAERRAGEFGSKKTIRLNVAGAFHSSLMAPAAQKFEAFLAAVPLQKPRLPVYSNVTGRPHGEPEEIRRLMVAQITSSVRWTECVQDLLKQGVQTFVECGPGKVLAGLLKRIDKSARVYNIQDHSGVKEVAGLNLWT